MSRTTIGNIRHSHVPKGRRADRTTEFGNPFRLQDDDLKSRIACILEYAIWMMRPEQKKLRERAVILRGDKCFCWCYPKLCHLDVLTAIADGRNWMIAFAEGVQRHVEGGLK